MSAIRAAIRWAIRMAIVVAAEPGRAMAPVRLDAARPVQPARRGQARSAEVLT
jgi:hypothetical protein